MKLVYSILFRGAFLSLSLLFFSNTGYSTITVDDLIPGDIIFFMDSTDHAEHVGVYSGIKSSDGKPYITHAVGDPYHSVITTLLKPHDEDYLVYRSTNHALALTAAYRMGKWAKMGVPYDYQAADLMANFQDDREFAHPKDGTGKLYQYVKKMSIPNFYRRIKFASRDNLPTLPKDDEIGSSGRGLRCDEAVILAYQVEEISEAIFKVSNFHEQGLWVSDKYTTDEILDELGASQEYREYRARLLSQDEYKVKQKEKRVNPNHIKYFPSIIAWNFNEFGPIEKFARTFDTVFPLDSKISNPDVLLFHVRQDPRHWEEIGKLEEVPVPQITVESKQKWQEEIQVRAHFTETEHKVAVHTFRDRALSTDFGNHLKVPTLLGLGLEPPTIARSSSNDSHDKRANATKLIQDKMKKKMTYLDPFNLTFKEEEEPKLEAPTDSAAGDQSLDD